MNPGLGSDSPLSIIASVVSTLTFLLGLLVSNVGFFVLAHGTLAELDSFLDDVRSPGFQIIAIY